MGRLTLFLLLCATLSATATGQPAPTPSQQRPVKGSAPEKIGTVAHVKTDLHLVRVETITSPSEVAQSFLSPVRCDADGNLYFRQDAVDGVHKLNRKGEPVALFQAAANTDKNIDAIAAFAIAPDGDLYQLVYPHEYDRYVFVYKSDGTFKSMTKLNPGFTWSPHAIAVFQSGQLLISASEYDRDRTAAKWPFTGIFGADGALLKEVELEDDETLHDMAASGDARVTAPNFPQSNRAVDLSQIEMASDGNGYLMRWTNPAIIYAISAGGEVVRRIKIEAGGPGYRPSKMHVMQNRIAVLFADPQTHEKVMRIVDLEGHEIASYDEPRVNGKPQGAMLGGAFACYTENPTRFVFLGANDDNKLQLWIAEPR